MWELQCVGVLVCGSCGVWELRGINAYIKMTHIFAFKTMLRLNGVGALQCGCVAVWVRCSIGVLPHGGVASMGVLRCGGSCGVGDFRCVGSF